MSDQFTPTLDEVRAIYALGTPAHHVSIGGSYAEIDRVIAKVRAEAKAEALREAADATQSWIESPLMCLSKCSDQECRDCIRIDALNEYATWLRARADKLDTL